MGKEQVALGLADKALKEALKQVTVSKTDFLEVVDVGITNININPLFNIVGSLSATTGNLNAGNTSYSATDFIDITTTSFLFRYVLDGSSAGVFTDFMCVFYDQNKVFVSGTNSGTAYTVEQHEGKNGRKYTIPANAKFVRLSCSNNNLPGGAGNLYTYLQVKSVRKNRLKDDYNISYTETYVADFVKNSKKLSGKKIATFTDSIFANFRDETGIPAIIAKNTGATVYNCGFGGTRMSARNDGNSQAQYWDKFSFSRIVDYIASGDFTPMETALPNMSSALSYFSETIQLLKSLNFNEIDIILIAYGTNDFTGENIVKNPADLTSIYTYYGAYHYAIEKLLTAYPHLRLVLVTPMYRFYKDASDVYLYDSDTHVIVGQKLTDFVEVVKQTGKDYHLPVIDNYYEMDANKFTRTRYFDASDGTHPNANGRKRVADRLSGMLESII